jgi:hypothetical protein
MIKASISLQELRRKDIPKGEVSIRHGENAMALAGTGGVVPG